MPRHTTVVTAYQELSCRPQAVWHYHIVGPGHVRAAVTRLVLGQMY